MTKRVQSKNKICRRLGVNLWGRAKNPIVKRDYPPGEHGAKRRKISGYGQQLAAKQKLRGYYANLSASGSSGGSTRRPRACAATPPRT